MSVRTWIERKARVGLAVAVSTALAVVDASAQTTQELKRMSLEDLLNLSVTTLSRGAEATTAAPAAVYVLTGDDIRRSGAKSLPEALRLVPGVQVARINAGTWAIGMRGFADRLARSMLVLMDGRAVYSPLFAGTYWEVQDTMIEDVDRIEVIRGPGGTLWGTNAVTGIINIITKKAKDSAGIVARGGGGSTERGFLSARYGAAIGTEWNYRVYAKVFDRTSQFHPTGLDYDGLRMARSGFRADWTPSNGQIATVQGDLYSGTLGQRSTISSYTPPFSQVSNVDAPLSGGHVLASWNGAPSGRSPVQLQTYYARTTREEVPVGESRDTVDVDFQQTLRHWRRHSLVWGLGYRVTSGNITAVAPTQFVPERRTDNLYSAFVQEEIVVVPERLRATLGSKIEHNDYTGVEWQPSLRLSLTPNHMHTVWGAVTRAVRTPSRVETDYTTVSLLNPAVPLFVRLQPNPAFVSEKLVAYETGYRVRPFAPLHVAVAAFYNDHDDVVSTEIFDPVPDPPSVPARLVVPVTFANGVTGNSYGVEVTGDARVASWWRVTANYSYLRIQMTRKPGSRDGSQVRRYEGLSPRYQVQLQSSLDLPRGWTFDAFVRSISKLDFGPIPGYVTSNLRLAWRATPRLELAIVGQDLNEPHHVEWASGSGNIEIRRSAYVELLWRR